MRTVNLTLIMVLIKVSILTAQISFVESTGIGNSNSWFSDIVDIDNDNDLDVLVNNYPQGPKLWINDGTGVLTESNDTLIKNGYLLADFNNDGLTDLVINDSICINAGNWDFSERYPFIDSLDGSIYLEDINNDFFIDIIQVKDRNSLRLFTGNSSYTFKYEWDTTYNFKINNLSIGDINNDSLKDIVVCVSDGQNLVLFSYKNKFVDSGQELGNYNSRQAVFGDFDNDGDMDIYMANLHLSSDFTRVHPDIVWLNNGTGTFSQEQELPKFKNYNAIAYDFDYDGDLDVFAPSTDNNNSRLWLNDGNANFTDQGLRMGNYAIAAVNIGDLDNDGDMDLFISCFNMTTSNAPNYIWFNNSTGIERLLYFNQDYPGDIPALFAPEEFAISSINTHTLSYSHDLKELLFTRLPDKKTYRRQFLNGKWGKAQVLINGEEGIFTPGGNRIYYQDEDIKFLEKTDNRWGNPQALPNSINTSMFEYYTTMAENGNLYFSRSLSQGNSKIFISNENDFSNVEQLSGPVNDYNAYHPWIAKNDSFIIFNSGNHPDGFGAADLYISFKNENGEFGEPVNLGNVINSDGSDLCPTLTPDEKYMFFTRLANDENNNWTGKLYWVETGFIKTLQFVTISNPEKQHVFFKIYPNPAQNTLQIEYPGLLMKEAYYKIIDLSGETVQQGEIQGNTIDVSELTKSVYFINLKIESETISKKIIIKE